MKRFGMKFEINLSFEADEETSPHRIEEEAYAALVAAVSINGRLARYVSEGSQAELIYSDVATKERDVNDLER